MVLHTGVCIEPKYWNPNKQRVRGTHPIADNLNATLEDQYYDAGRKSLDTGSARAVKHSLRRSTGSLTAYFEKFIEELDSADRYWDWRKYRVTLGKLQACLGPNIDWAEIDRHALTRFEQHLREECRNSKNTTRKELQRVRRVVRQAVRDEVIRPETDPFLTYDLPKRVTPSRRRLSWSEIRQLEDLSDEKLAARDVLARDAFLLAFYGGGIRFSDVCRLAKNHLRDDRLEYRVMKTDALVSIRLPDRALHIIARHASDERPYVFPFLRPGDEDDPNGLRRRISSCNVTVNESLKRVAEAAGLAPDGLSFHVARHTFADLARQKSGDLYAVQKSLGHRRVSTTQEYLQEFDRDAVDRLADTMWNDAE